MFTRKKADESPTQRPTINTWRLAQHAKIEVLAQSLTGSTWLQLDDRESSELSLPARGRLLTKNILNHSSNMGRLTELSEGSVDAVICNDVLQRHPNPLQVIREINHLLRPGGMAIFSGAGSLRGRLAAHLPNNTPTLPEVLLHLNNETQLQLLRCHGHGTSTTAQPWKKSIEQAAMKASHTAMTYLPSSLILAQHWAATRPGWVLLLQDKRYTPLLNNQRQRPSKQLNLSPSGVTLNHHTHEQYAGLINTLSAHTDPYRI